MDQRLMNLKVTSIYLGMTEAALRKNIYLRRFDSALIKIGGRIFFDKEKLDKILNDSAIKINKRRSNSWKRR